MDQIAITRTVTVAAGPFAAGHLGELTRLLPFEMIDEVLTATRRTQQRIRLLPARVVVYLLIAGCLFADLGYRQVWSKLVAGLHPLPVPEPSGSALRQARQRLDPAPMRALFELLRARAATSAATVWWRGLMRWSSTAAYSPSRTRLPTCAATASNGATMAFRLSHSAA